MRALLRVWWGGEFWHGNTAGAAGGDRVKGKEYLFDGDPVPVLLRLHPAPVGV
jgi:hypothetical protein